MQAFIIFFLAITQIILLIIENDYLSSFTLPVFYLTSSFIFTFLIFDAAVLENSSQLIITILLNNLIWFPSVAFVVLDILANFNRISLGSVIVVIISSVMMFIFQILFLLFGFLALLNFGSFQIPDRYEKKILSKI
jgi:hypothetical protein